MYLTDLDKAGIAALITEWNQPRFRTDQVMAWLNKGARPEETNTCFCWRTGTWWRGC